MILWKPLDLSHSFGTTTNNGNLTGLTEKVYPVGASTGTPTNSLAATYTYDNVNRVSNATESGGWSEGYSFDQFGNMWVSTYSGISVTPATPTTQSFYTASNNRFTAVSYDGVGNQLTALYPTTSTFAYDAESRQKSAFNTINGTSTYTYDGAGHRVTKVLGAVTTTFVYDALGRLAAEYSTAQGVPDCTTCYLVDDHLGDTRLVLDESANVMARHDYLPFGGELTSVNGRTTVWGATDNINQKFTGKERDSESGLDYFGARYYGSALGRFTGADPSNLSVDFWLPQTWNRYAYSLNNPLSVVDRNGLWPTYIHNEIINEAFPGLSASDLKSLQDASYNTDYNNRVNGHGPQDPEDSFVHGMSDGVHSQDPTAAQAMGDRFIADNENGAKQAQAAWTASGNAGVAPGALTAFGNALHTVTDRTSPAHAGNQPWNGTAGTRNKIAAADHIRRELHPTDAQRANAVHAAQNAFLQTFGWQMFLQATTPVKACVSTWDSTSKKTTTTCQ